VHCPSGSRLQLHRSILMYRRHTHSLRGAGLLCLRRRWLELRMLRCWPTMQDQFYNSGTRGRELHCFQLGAHYFFNDRWEAKEPLEAAYSDHSPTIPTQPNGLLTSTILIITFARLSAFNRQQSCQTCFLGHLTLRLALRLAIQHQPLPRDFPRASERVRQSAHVVIVHGSSIKLG